MNELGITYRKVSDLKPFENNARTHTESQVRQIADSIRAFGFNNPILVDSSGVIVAGHGRVAAASLLGVDELPTVELSHLSDEDVRAYVIADNRLAELAGWDTDLLAAELGALSNVELTGFTHEDLERFLAKQNHGLTDPDAVPEVEDIAVSECGDIWLLGKHRLVCGDSTDAHAVDACLDGVMPHLMVTDPPYGVNYDPKWRAEAGVNKNKEKMGAVKNDSRSDWRETWELFPGDVAYVWHADRYASEVQQSLERAGFTIRCQIVWAKDRFALSRGDYHWQHEPCWYAVRKGATGHWAGDRKQSTLWNINARDDSGHGHGTQKPVECMRRPIVNNSNPGQVVYEPFCGSGTTIIAAEMEGRICNAIEINPKYVDVAIKRWQDFTGQDATRFDDGKRFNELVE